MPNVGPRIILAILFIGMVACMAVYWVGLRGPFMFDDVPTFGVIEAWLVGKSELQSVLFANTSPLTHRSLSMASFALGAKAFGYSSFTFKAVNLGLHLFCGLLAYRVLSLMLDRDRALSSQARIVAAFIVVAWWLHPFNVSTVLYAVQRMTQLAAICCLLGVWFYISIRTRIERDSTASRWLALFAGIPLLTLLGITAKQNAVVLPGLCLVVELAYFRMPRRWPKLLWWFYLLYIALPALAISAYVFANPDSLLDGFSMYSFTLPERLLSEGRVLVDYVQMLVAPNPPRMGVYTDDYVASTGLMSPPSTLFSLLALTVASVTAWRMRQHSSSVFAGWFLFLMAHSVEASFLPIELYYEHRNYLPSLGLFLAIAGIIGLMGQRLRHSGLRTGRMMVVIGAVVLALLALQTHGRARVWSDRFVLAESELANHPDSTRAVLIYIWLAKLSGDPARAYVVVNQTIKNTSDPKLRGLAQLFRIRMNCELHGKTPPGELAQVVEPLPPHVDLVMTQVMSYTAFLDDPRRACKGITRGEFADALAKTVDRAVTQPDSSHGKWMLRYAAARLYATEGNWVGAERQGRMAWQPAATAPVAEPLIRALVKLDRRSEAEVVYREALARSNPELPEDAAGLARYRALITGQDQP